ncbi:YceI family protein [Sanguibacter hominis ATCC BAA-789]|uniref:YceI family protein n=1 Tax=Sanguibacter hominis ATCC BAA-789 TaxID=1312740 RepID=A0A9X5FHU5_9MICO|nr:YceI family protein [Sanguibacter hominis]NKX92363.1 YceI family protein [Sanguibacter hominis ATCC BAA-789]
MTALPTGLAPATYTIDGSHTQAGFTVRHAGISKVRGTVPVTEGTIVIGEDVETSSVTAVLDATALSTGDTNRDAHLQSADFFSTDVNPTWSFTSTSVKADGSDFIVTGDLTIAGVTKPVELALEYTGSAVDAFGASRAGFEASVTISRKEWGITWNAALEAGGVLVSDKVAILIEVSAVKA